MQYLLMIYEDEMAWRKQDAETIKSMFDEYGAFGQAAAEAGKMVDGAGLEPTSTATTIRVRDGERIVSDGPYLETKEQLGGYYLLECDSLDEAIAWAERIPGARNGGVEIRPVMNVGDVVAGAENAASQRA